VDDDCGGSDICLEGTCEAKTGATHLGCANVVLCEDGCFDSSCPQDCDEAATMIGAQLYNALNLCQSIACPTGDPVCWQDAALAGGACYAQAVACQQDP